MEQIGDGFDQFGRYFRRMEDAQGNIYRVYSPEEWFGWDTPQLSLGRRFPNSAARAQQAKAARDRLAHAGHNRR